MKIAIVNLITASSSQSLLQVPMATINPTKDEVSINIVDLANHIAKNGHTVDLFISDAFKPLQQSHSMDKNLQLIYLPTIMKTFFPPTYIPFTPSLTSEISKGGYDIIQSGEFLQWGTILCAKVASDKAPSLVIWHELSAKQRFPGNMLQSLYAKTIGQYVARKTKQFIPRSCRAKAFLLNMGIPYNKIGSVIYSGVNTEIFFPLQKSGKFNDYFPSKGDFLISSVGRLVKRKGHASLIRAFKTVCEKHPEARLIIIGEGPEKLTLNKLIKDLSLQNKVKILSHIPNEELHQLYTSSELMVLPSLELFPNFSILESLACGTPVIFSSPGGENELDGDGYAGFYVPFGDPIALANKITEIIENSSMKYAMSRNAIDLVRRKFDMKLIAHKLIQTYSQILQ